MKILRKFYTTVLLAACLAGGAQALPEGANVVHGNVQINNSGGTQTIVQGSNQAIINWNGFNIDVGELVQFIQPSSISAILNRVVGQDPSMILGSLKANGQVFLVNPNGVVFGDGAMVDVGSLVVSTLNISDDNFLKGNYTFEQATDKELASVINHGTIKIDDNGFLVLTGPMVANEGVILARVGQVALAGGTKSTVSFDPTGMIQVELPSGSQSNDGIVSLSTSDTSDLLSSLVAGPNSQAGRIVTRDGRTFLEVASGTVVNTGQIRAEGTDGQSGGRIVLDSTAHTLLADGSVLSAAGQGAESSGGEVYVLSGGEAVSAAGSLIDVSGGTSGDGGFAEQSSHTGQVAASIDLSAQDGKAGTFLIDPERILVQTGGGGGNPPPNVVVVTENTIESVASGTVLLQTQDGVDFQHFFDGQLMLQNDVNLTIDLTSVGGDGSDAITFASPGESIVLNGTGAFTLTNATGNNVNNLNVTTADGDINVDLGNGKFNGFNTFSSTNGSATFTNAGVALGSGSVSVALSGPGTASFSSNDNEVSDLSILTDTGAITLDLSLGGVLRNANSLTSNTGMVTATAQSEVGPTNPGWLTIQTLGDANVTSTGPLRIRNTDVDSFTGTGQSFLVDGDNLASTAFNLNISGDASGDGARFGGQLQAPTVSVTADSIGADAPLEFDADTVTMTATTMINADLQPSTYSGNSVTVTNNNVLADTYVSVFSEGEAINDLGGVLYLDGTDIPTLTYNTLGDRAIDAYDYSGDNLNFNTDGAVTGTAAIDGIFTVTAGSVDLTGTAIAEPFLGNYYDLTANTGDVSFDFSDIDYASVAAHSTTGSVTVTSLGDLGVDLTAANTVDVTATDIYGTFDAPVLNATATMYGVDLTQTGTTDTTVNIDAAGGTGGVFLTTNGAVASRGISGSYVGINVNGAGNGVTNSSGRIVAPEMIIQAPGSVDVATTTGILTVNSMGDVTVDNQSAALDPLSADIRTSPTGDISLTTVGLIVDFPPGEVMPPPPSYFEGNSVTLNAVGIDADVNANAVNATATGGPIDLALLGPDTLVNAAASSGAAPVTVASMGNISAGNIQGDFVDLSTAGTGTVISANATDRVLANGTLHVMSGGAVDLLTTSNRIDIFASGSVDIDNQSIAMTPLTATIRALGPSDINLTTDNAIGSFDPFPIQGPIVDSELNGATVNVTATGIDSIFFADTLNATATTGDAVLHIYGGSTNLSASALMGSVNVDANSDLFITAAGVVAGNSIDLSAFTEGPTAIVSSPGLVDAPMVTLGADTLDVDLGGSVTDLQTFSFADTTIDANSAAVSFNSQTNSFNSNLAINNAGGSLTGTATVNDGSTVTLTGSDVNASVTGVDSLTVNATAGAGNVVLGTSASLSTIHAGASGNVVTTTGNMNTLGGNITGAMVTLHASNVDQTTVDSPDLVLDITGSTAVVDLLAATTSVTGTVLNDFTLSSADGNIAIGAAGLNSTNLGTANFNAPKGSVVSTSAVPGESVVDVSAAIVNADSANLKFGPNLVSLNSTTVGDATFSAGSSMLAVSGSSGGAFNVTNAGDIDATSAVNSVTGITAGSAKLTGANVNAQVTAAAVDAQATAGTATLNLLADTSVTGSSIGLFQITANGNVGIGAAGLSSDSMVDIAAPNGNLTGPGTIDAPMVQLGAQDIDVDLGANTAGVNADSSVGNVVLRGNSSALDVASTAPGPSGNVTVSNTGSLTTGPLGIVGDLVTLSGADVTADVVANTVFATSTVGDVNLQTFFVPVSVGGSAAGSFSATTSGQDLTVDPSNIIANTSVSLSTGGGGAITGSGVVDAPSVDLLGSSVDVNLGTSVTGVNSTSSGDTTLHSDSANFTGTGSTGSGNTYTVMTGLGSINSDLSGVLTDHLVLDSATTISSTVNSSILTLDATSNGMTAITTDTSGFTVTGSTGTGNLFSMLTTGGDITSDFTGLTTDFLQLDSAAGINSSMTAPNVNATAANGDITLGLQAPSTTVDAVNNTVDGKVTVNSVGDVVVGTFSGLQALGSVTVNNSTGSLSGSGVVNGPSVILNSDSIDVNLGVNVDSVNTTSTGNTTLRTDNPPTTATGSTGSGATYSFTANAGALNTDFSGVTTDNLVLSSVSTIDTTVNSAIGALNTTSNGDTTIHATSAAFPVSGTTGTGNTFTMMTTVGDITSDFTGLATDFLVLDSAAGINSSVAAPSVNATAQNGDVTLGLQAASTTVDATANAAGGDITLNSSGDIVVGTTTGLSAAQSVTVNNPSGSLSGSGTIDAPTVLLNSDTISAILGSNVANLTTTSTGNTSITGNSANLTLTATTGAGGTFALINNAGSIDADLTNVISNSISLTATDIMATLSAATVDATATNGDVLLNLLAPSTTVNASATAAGGDVTVNSSGDIVIGTGSGVVANQSVTLSNTGHNISGTGTVDAPAITVNSGNVALNTGSNTSSLSLNLSGTGDVQASSADLSVSGSSGAGQTVSVNNQGGNLNTNFFVSDGALNFTASGDLTGGAGAATLNLQGGTINMGVSGGDVSANATNGNVTLTGSATSLQGSAVGLFSATLGGDFSVGNITANQINLESSAAGRQGAMAGNVTSLNGTKLAASNVTVAGAGVNVDTQAQTIQATGTNGVTVRNTGTTVNSANFEASSGSVNFSTSGNAFNVSSQGLNSTLTAGGVLTGTVDDQFGTTVSGSSVNLTSLSSRGLNLTTTTGAATIQATPKSNFFEVSADVAGALDLVTTTGDIILYGVNAGGAANLTAQNGAIVHNVEAPGLLTAGSANLNALNDIVLNVDTPSVRATSSAGKVDLNSVGTVPITVAGSAAGDFSVGSSGDIVHQDVSAANITLDASSANNISKDTTSGLSPAARLTAPGKVTLTGNNVTAETDAGSIEATATNDATIDNFSASVDPVAINAGHDASFTSVGTANISQLNSTNNLTLDVGQAVTGSFQGNKVTLAGTSVTANVQANELTTTARSGDATITSNSTNKLTLTDSTASGNFSLTHKGDVEFNRIEAQNVNISTTGNITDTANTIVASGITLNGNNVFVNTQGQVIVITAQGDVTITNKIVDVNALTIDAQGSVDFGTEGNLHINNVVGGPLAKLTSGGSMTAETNALVKAAKIQLAAGGNITPDLNNPLNLQATDSIEVTAHVVNLQAQGSSVDPSIAAALNGNLGSSGVTIGQGSGPIYYNGVLLNGTPAPTPPPSPGVSPGDAGNQIGQQNGQVIDDGSVGSAANDGLVEQSPTQKLVAQLTEQASGSGDGVPTSALITLEVDALGELEVKLQTPSPQDEKIDNSNSMSADDVLDLDTDELSDVKVALYYDPATDQLILAVDLRADDILDLDVSNFQEIPINLNYSFLSDPKLCLEKLRANDLIDLEVEDLGEIPIKVHVEGDDRSASE